MNWMLDIKVDYFFASLCESGIVKAHHEGWARKATQEVFELERAVEVRCTLEL